MRRSALLVVAVLSLSCAHQATVRPTAVTAADSSDTAPPPEKSEDFPEVPPAGKVWQPGYWIHQNGQWVWLPGKWLDARQGSDWTPAHWQQLPDGTWHLTPGSWTTAS